MPLACPDTVKSIDDGNAEERQAYTHVGGTVRDHIIDNAHACIFYLIILKHALGIIANEPAERRRSAGEAAENSAAQRMAYAKKFSIELWKV